MEDKLRSAMGMQQVQRCAANALNCQQYLVQVTLNDEMPILESTEVTPDCSQPL